ncbi:MAG TPA: beta-ketoacyl synthase N-terminal-like domain-containing protein, partial [Pyrinomonadaceae bacterium]
MVPRTETEKTIASVWREVLQIDRVDVDDNFFDLGGHSLLIVRLQYLLQQLLQAELTVTDLFEYPTIRSLAKHLSRKKEPPATVTATTDPITPARMATRYNDNAIAIIGMAANFPGCRDLDHFWENLSQGTELISRFSEQELDETGIDHALVTDEKYIRAGAVLQNIEMFDASFFKFSPREARLIDVQQRIFLECAWEALEHAGYDADDCDFAIGIFGGAAPNDYLTRIQSYLGKISPEEWFEIEISNEREQLAARAAYKLNLHGPSINVQTACSTSLVAVHMACQSLIRKECHMALAGGVSVRSEQKQGYLYQQGGIYSPDGHCRAFDAKAQGTVPGNGAGIVVLKRLRDAINTGDSIHAVILGSAVNNDGSSKIGYTAPSVEGQFEVISQALRNAGVSAATVNCIEAHGTGTPLGDPVEVAALTKAFRVHTSKSGFCALGSVKTNMGHLGPAAGIAGLIKIVLALKHKQLPPSLHFVEPNPAIDFASSPFFVNTTLRDWSTNDAPRRAGVSSFGIGGTNAHVVLQEAPAEAPSETEQSDQLLLLSAKTSSALEAMTDRLVAYLKDRPDANLADVAYTLKVGRRAFDHRRMLVCSSVEDAWTALEKREPTRVFTGVADSNESLDGSAADDLESLGQVWLTGAKIDWQPLHNGARRRRIALPAYPFERQRHWIEKRSGNSATTVSHRARRTMRDWFYVPLWKQSLPPQPTISFAERERWLVFCDRSGVGRKISERLVQAGHETITVDAGVSYARIGETAFSINPDRREDYSAL